MMKQFVLGCLLLGSLSASAQKMEQVIGCWVMPNLAGENLQLNRDGNFNFNDYNTLTKSTENLYGTWKKSGNKVTLMYDDRPQQNFTLLRNKKGEWILRKVGGFQFRKATPAGCQAH